MALILANINIGKYFNVQQYSIIEQILYYNNI